MLRTNDKRWLNLYRQTAADSGKPYPGPPAVAAAVVATATAAPRPPTRPALRLHRSNAVGFRPQMS